MIKRTFATAAARRRQDPIVWSIDGTEIKLRPSVDLAEIIPLVEELQAETAGPSVTVAVSKRIVLVKTVRTFVDQASWHLFDRIADDLDVTMLSEMVTELVQEYAGSPNRTKQASLSEASSEAGDTLTATQPLETSMPSV